MSVRADIVAVVVTYRPQHESLLRLLDALAAQVARTVVVDNSPESTVADWLAGRNRQVEERIAFGANRGIAAAHNAGIARARSAGARYVALFDQDSEPASGMIERLAHAAERLAASGHRVAAVGPRFVDPRQPGMPGMAGADAADAPAGVASVDFVISSGALLPLATLDVVGGMNEALFIDYVDIEWGWRARHRGYRSFAVPDAVLRHALGDAPIEFLGRRFPSHSPVRDYYRYRNAVWLYRQPWAPAAWKRADAGRLAKRFVLVALRAPARLRHLRMMMLGIWHGLRGRLGPLAAG